VISKNVCFLSVLWRRVILAFSFFNVIAFISWFATF
jgi:hypothetical protein